MSEGDSKPRSHWPISILSSISTFFALLLPLVLVRLLPPDEVGNFKIFFLYLTIIPAFSFSSGIMSGLAYWVGQPQKGRAAIKASAMLLLLAAALFSLLAVIFRHQLASVLGWNEVQTLYFAIALFGAIAGPFFEEAAISSGRIWTGALFYSGAEFIRAAAILFAAIQYQNLTAILMAHTIVVTIKVVLGYIYALRLDLVGFSFSKESLAAVMRYAWPVSLAWVFGIFLNYADQLLLSTSIPSAEFAVYSIGCLSIAPLLIYEHSITRVLIPQMSAAFAAGKTEGGASLYKNAVLNLGFLLIPAVAGLMVFAGPIIEILFTPRYAEAAKYLRLYSITYLLLIIPYDALARARGKSGWILRTFIIFSLFSLLLVYLFARLWGPMGALGGILVSGAAMRLYSIAYFTKVTQLNPTRFLPFKSFAFYTAVCLALAAGCLALHPLFQSERIWFFVCAPLFALLYLPITLSLRGYFAPDSRRPVTAAGSAPGILIVTQSLDIGGLERMVLQLCDKLKAENQWRPHVLAYDQNRGGSRNLLPEFAAKKIPVEAFKKSRGFSPLVVLKILRNVSRNKISILHSHDLGGLIYATAAKMLFLGRLRIVHTQHSFIHLSRKSRYRTYERLLTRFVDKLSVVSADTLETYLELGFDRERIHLIENGVEFIERPIFSRHMKVEARRFLINQLNEQSLRSMLLDNLNGYWILYVARFFPGKGQNGALAIWNALPPTVREKSVLCFIGPESQDGQYDQIQKLRNECFDKERVLFLGACSQPHSWLAGADVYLSCSEYEGMPLGPLEAAGSGVPTLLSDIPGHRFLKQIVPTYPLHNCSAGASELARILSQLQDEGEKYLLKFWNSTGGLRECFSVDKMCRKYSALYAEQLENKPGSFSIVRESIG